MQGGDTGHNAKVGAAARNQSDQERRTSVHRRASPWYRTLARTMIALGLLGVLGVGLFAGARLVQNYTERARLPDSGADVPTIRTSTFQLRSSSPAPAVDGTLTIDTVSRAFKFVGRNGGPHTGIEVVSPDGARTYIRRSQGDWQLLDGNEAVGESALGVGTIHSGDLLEVVSFLADDTSADSILTDRLRRGYVDLVELVTEGAGEIELDRYEMLLNTSGLSADYPLQWQAFRDRAVPGVVETPALSLIIWIDADDVLVRVSDETTNWSWERLAYSDLTFTPVDPALTNVETVPEPATETDDQGEPADDG